MERVWPGQRGARERRDGRVCTGTLVHYEQTVRDPAVAAAVAVAFSVSVAPAAPAPAVAAVSADVAVALRQQRAAGGANRLPCGMARQILPATS